MTKTESGRALNELTGVDDVVARYGRPGPHATVIMQFPPPGQAGDDRMVRWHVRRSELVDAGAADRALDHLDALIADARASPDLQAELTTLVGTHGLLDLIATVGFYATLAFIVNSFDTPLDADIAEALARRPLG